MELTYEFYETYWAGDDGVKYLSSDIDRMNAGSFRWRVAAQRACGERKHLAYMDLEVG